MDTQVEPREGDADHEEHGKGPRPKAAESHGQVAPYHNGVLGVAAGKPSSLRLHKGLHPGIVFKGPGLVDEFLCRGIDIRREEKEEGQSRPCPLVHAPVDEGQQNEIKALVAQEGEKPERPIQQRAEALQPQDELNTPVERALDILPPDAIGKGG